MRNARKRWSLGASLLLVAGAGLALATPATASAAPMPSRACAPPSRSGHIADIVPATGTGRCPAESADSATGARSASAPAIGDPLLLYHGGPVMMTPSSSPLVITPIFWNPAAYPMAASYKSLITTYLADVASANGANSVLNQYSGSNGQISYKVSAGTAISDTNALPASGCTVASNDKTGIYADGTGYSACLDDAQLQAQVNSVTSAHGLPHNLSHLYVLFLPKHVESCFSAGSTITSGNECTINHNPSAAYCAYHNYESSAVYVNLPFPAYSSGTGDACGSDGTFGVVESPNSNPDADTAIDILSGELCDAITNPDTSTGWYDSNGFEIADECAGMYGTTRGTAGMLYNQVINGHHYLTQEEFSNDLYAQTGSGCVPSLI